MEVSAIERLLGSFATAALGLELTDRIRDLNVLTLRTYCSNPSVQGPTAWAAWKTDRGMATFRAVYDEAQSLRAKAHVVKIAWWINEDHHDGWWHCYPKFPRDWIKGYGRT